MQCDLCGKEEELFLTEIEGTKLNVCKGCSKFGKVIKKIEKRDNVTYEKKEPITKIATPDVEIVQLIVPNFNKIIKGKREKLGLKQKELAKIIAEKESVIHKLESGLIEPNLGLVRKLEKFLKVKLVEEQEVTRTGSKATISSDITIGDLIKIKKK